MPRRAVLRQLELVLKANAGQFTDFDLVHLAMHFGVAGQAMMLRLIALRKMSRDLYREYWQGRTFEAMADVLGYDVDDDVWKLPAVLPTRYRYLAMKAYEEDEISLAKLAELLREPYHELRSKLQQAVGAVREP
jgi:hypothetical protein